MSWKDDALCKGRMDLFFAPPRERPANRAQRETAAFGLCARCPSKRQCREASVGQSGIWAGRYLEEGRVIVAGGF
jgi:WhiB family redox-sensing transcriptional regulator